MYIKGINTSIFALCFHIYVHVHKSYTHLLAYTSVFSNDVHT